MVEGGKNGCGRSLPSLNASFFFCLPLSILYKSSHFKFIQAVEYKRCLDLCIGSKFHVRYSSSKFHITIFDIPLQSFILGI